MKVIWAAFLERSVQDLAVSSLINVAAFSAVHGCMRMVMPYARTDLARDLVVKGFMENTDDPSDVLVMLDNDHDYPEHIVVSLAQHDPQMGVVGALAFRRGKPFDPCFWLRRPPEPGQERGDLVGLHDWPEGSVLECASVGTGAIAIRRWVFEAMKDLAPLYFHYAYDQKSAIFEQPSEDVIFARRCEALGIKHYVDTRLEIPHITTQLVTKKTYVRYFEKLQAEAGAPAQLETMTMGTWQEATHDDA